MNGLLPGERRSLVPVVASTRRTLLKLLVGSISAIRIPALCALPVSTVVLGNLFAGGRQQAIAMGRDYLRRHPGEWQESMELGNTLDQMGATGLGHTLDYLRHRITQDFLHQDVATIYGWVVARTEAQLCALVVLSDTK